MIVSHQCKTCPTILTYELRTNRRVYCEPCRIAAHKASAAITQRMRDARFGRANRGCIRGTLARVETEEQAFRIEAEPCPNCGLFNDHRYPCVI